MLCLHPRVNTNPHIMNMKKSAILAAALFCCPVLSAQEAAPAPAPAAAPSAAELEALVNEIVTAMNDSVSILESVTDTASADAAAVKLVALAENLEATQGKLEAMGENLDEESQMMLLQKLFPVIMTVGPRMEAASTRIVENDFYGSEALKAVLGSAAE